MLRVTIWRSDLSFTFSYSFSSLGSSAWQGPHQVAQTLMSTDLPSRFFNRHVLPARSANSKAGIVLVAFSQRPSANSCALAAGGGFPKFQGDSVPPVSLYSAPAPARASSFVPALIP